MSALSAQTIFDALHAAGLRVALAPGNGLVVSPASRLTHDLRDLIRGNKAALLDCLQAANDLASHDPDESANSRLVGLSRVVLPLAEKLAEPPEPPKQPIDPDARRVLAHAYHAHHFNCRFCIAAGRGTGYGERCGTGAALHAAYENAHDESKTSS